MIYLDNNSTTPLHPLVIDTIHQCYQQNFFNPASQHQLGQRARRALETSRLSILQMLGGRTTGMASDSLILTSGGTESNNLALIGLAQAAAEEWRQKFGIKSQDQMGQILISSIEHPSLVGAAEHLARLGFHVVKVHADQDGMVCLDSLSKHLDQPTLLVSIMLANNETGVLQPIGQAVELTHKQGALFHTDAVQAVGKIPIDFQALAVDALSFTAHKFNGPRGIGGLILRHGITLQPILFGGFQQMGLRPGTEDVALVKGMEKALSLLSEEPDRYQKVGQLRDHLQARLLSEIPHATVIGKTDNRLPTTLNIAFSGIDRQALLLAADMAGIAISTGSACASGSSEPSPVLVAMGLPTELIESSIRISLGVFNTNTEVEKVVSLFSQMIDRMRPIESSDNR